MLRLGELLDRDALSQMLADGYIRQQLHPSAPLAVLNYTEEATFNRYWNVITRTCRGLIYNTDSDEVVARPFPKFFNYGEEDVDHSYYSVPVTVTDKLDGSLGICYSVNGELAVSTRGSFISVQALHATEVLRARYAGWRPPEDMTVLFEIIYPGNRIVCNYGSQDDLFLLGAVSITHGWSCGPEDYLGWPGPRTTVFECASFQDAIEMAPREGAEGIVVHFPSRDLRLKIKQADYVAMHRLVTGLNERRVWELMSEGTLLRDILAPLPEEFHFWVRQTYDSLESQWYALYDRVLRDYEKIMAGLPEGFTRKDFALEATKKAEPAMLFNLLDARNIGRLVWQRVRPAFRFGPWQRNEDIA